LPILLILVFDLPEGRSPHSRGVPLRIQSTTAGQLTRAQRRRARRRRRRAARGGGALRLRYAAASALLVGVAVVLVLVSGLGRSQAHPGTGANVAGEAGNSPAKDGARFASTGTGTPEPGGASGGGSGSSGSASANPTGSGPGGSTGGNGSSTGSSGSSGSGSVASGGSGEAGSESEGHARSVVSGSTATDTLLGGPALPVAAIPDAKVATGVPVLVRKLAHQMSLAGSGSGAYVYDVTTGEELYQDRGTQMRAPASVEKLYTSTATLMEMGPTARLTTKVLSTGHLGEDGTFEGNLYLYGGGDPTFGTRAFIAGHYENKGTSVSMLVEALKRQGIRKVRGDIEGDESYWDYLRGDPSSGFAPDIYLEGTLSALEFNRGETGGLRGQHATAAYTALQFKRGLEAGGIKVEGKSGAALAPHTAREIAQASSPQLSELLHLMLPPSDNFFAESLVKDLGVRYGGAGTTKAGVADVRAEIEKLGLRPEIVDGSGLDRGDHTSPEQVVDLLRTLSSTEDGQILRDDLAVAGKDGTLEERMLNTFATGRCEGKTGTLTGVSNLAGYCNAANGDLIAFAFFNDDIDLYTAHTIQDAMAETVADY
jgi:D-alanyl-D-alanine carboxypeptidase/D-alanyl-D-alanine-endopeptidase (penicillin-binding protein 4)